MLNGVLRGDSSILSSTTFSSAALTSSSLFRLRGGLELWGFVLLIRRGLLELVGGRW